MGNVLFSPFLLVPVISDQYEDIRDQFNFKITLCILTIKKCLNIVYFLDPALSSCVVSQPTPMNLKLLGSVPLQCSLLKYDVLRPFQNIPSSIFCPHDPHTWKQSQIEKLYYVTGISLGSLERSLWLHTEKRARSVLKLFCSIGHLFKYVYSLINF